MKPNNRLIHVCPPYIEGRNLPIRGAMILRCGRCGGKVSASPASIEAVKQGRKEHGVQSVVICIPCSIPMIKQSGEPPEVMPMSPGQIQEIKDNL